MARAERRTRVCRRQAAIDLNFAPDGTRVGARRVRVSPSPSCPSSLRPNVNRRPSSVSAAVWYPPARTSMKRTPGSLTTCGLRTRCVPEGSASAESRPSCPCWFDPQLKICPSEVSATEWYCPQETVLTNPKLVSLEGVFFAPASPVPSWPWSFLHAQPQRKCLENTQSGCVMTCRKRLHLHSRCRLQYVPGRWRPL